MDFDWRVVVVLAPVIVAASWAAFNIGAAALRQVQGFLNRQA
jgi:photosystem II PsbY protein